MARAILTLNAGSSSMKFALFRADGALRLAMNGQIEGIGTAPHLVAHGPDGAVLTERRWEHGEARLHEEFLGRLLDWVDHHLGGDRLAGAGHRIVHGGPDFGEPVEINDGVLAELEKLCPLAPLHQPHGLAAVRALAALRPSLPQVACFDTGFHLSQEAVVRRVALPRRYADEGVCRYGFHGISYEYIAGRLQELAPDLARGKTIVAHLGNGASLCALRGGKSADTTMGFTALDGLMMGTRCGAIDPGILLYLQQQHGIDEKAMETLLYHQCGLLGVSGVSSDMRALLASEDPHAKEAIELFVFRLAREAGGMMSTLGGLDGLVFTAGIGENSWQIREAACARLAWLGLRLDKQANRRGGTGRISTKDSLVQAWVIPTDEELMIARHTQALIGAAAGVTVPG
jgi:acetate kinase